MTLAGSDNTSTLTLRRVASEGQDVLDPRLPGLVQRSLDFLYLIYSVFYFVCKKNELGVVRHETEKRPTRKGAAQTGKTALVYMGVLVEGPAVRVLLCGSGFRDGQCGMPGRLTNNTTASFGHSQPTGRSFYAPNRLQNLQEQQATSTLHSQQQEQQQ